MAASNEPSLVALANQNDALWKEAYEKFKNDSEMYERLQSIISKDSKVTKDAGQEQQLGDLLLRKRRIMEDKQWVLHWRKKAIKIGRQFDKIVEIFKLIEPIGHAAAKLDPLHAGIPWACVAILLPLILNHSEEQEAALNGLQKVTEIVQQFSSFSWDYLNIPREKSEKQLKESIVKLYWKILRYEATAIFNFNRNTISRYAASIIRKDGWKKQLKDIEYYRNNFMTDLQLNDSQTQKLFESHLRKLIQGPDRTYDKNLEIIEWVSVIPYISRHYTARQLLAQYPHAGEWIIKKYTRWLRCDGAPALWLRETIGTGKTSIVSTVIESFYSDIARQDDQRMVYFYCISPTTSNDVVRSLVSQLAWTLNGKEIESSIIDMFNDAQPPQSTEPTPEDWLKALLKLCQRVNKVKMVIDALDECRDFGRLLKTLERLKIERGNCVFPESDGVILTVEDTSEDISRYIADEVRSKEEDIECNVEAAKKELINRINLALISFAGGMFKWVALQLAVMFPMDEQTFYPENIQVQLQNIENRTLNKEQSLNNAYGAVYTLNNKPGPYNSRVSMGLYKWLLCCKKALPTEEVVKIIELSLDNDPDFEKLTRNPLSTKVVLHCCSNFVIRSADDTFRFAHLSVEEYLVNYCGVKVEFQPEQCHFFVMKMCLALISTRITRPVSKQKQELVSNLQQRPKGSKEAEMLPQKRASPVERIHDSSFLKYSISYWAYHSRRVPFEIRSNEILYKSFVLGPKLSLSLQWWYSRIKARKFEETIDSQYPRNNAMFLSELPVPDQNLLESCLLMLGAVFDLPEVISNGLRGCGEGIDRQIFARRTPLLVAIYYGSPKSVQYLLDHGANPCLKSSGHGGGTDEGMVFWVTRQGSSHQTKVEERLKVEEILLNNKHSRQAFLNQLERSLMIHPEPLRAMKVLHQAEIETPVFANIIEKQIKTEGLGKLIDFLDCMNDENFDDEMVLGVIHFDSSKTVKRVFEFKRIEKVTELMVQNALKSDDPETFAYFMTEFDPGVSIQKLVIDEKLRRPEIWKIILAVKGSHFVN